MRHALSSLFVILACAATVPAAELDRYLVDDTDAVVGLDVRMLLKTPLVQKNYLPLAKKQLAANAELQKNLKELGFDPLRDLDRVLVVHGDSCHRMVDGKDEFVPLIIVRGRFDTMKIQTKLAQIAQFVPTLLKIQKTSDGTYYELHLGDKTFYVALPERTAVVASAVKEHITDALAKARNRKKTKFKHLNIDFLVEQADNRHAIWVVALGYTALTRETPLPTAKGKKVEANVRKKLSDSGIDEITGGVQITDSVKALVRVKVEDVDTAKQIAEVAQLVLPMLTQNNLVGKLDDKKLAPAMEFLRSLTVSTTDRYVVVNGELANKSVVESLK
jgi:hypothetical protein